jgi:hypothetical protein
MESISLQGLCSEALTKSEHRGRQLDTKELYNEAYRLSQVPCQAFECTDAELKL